MTAAVLVIWCLRIPRWPVRWALINWLGACSSIFFGLACLQYVLLDAGPEYDVSAFWSLFACLLIAWTPLAAINGFLFLMEAFSWENRRQNESRLRRNGAI